MTAVSREVLGDLQLPVDPLTHQAGGVNDWNLLPISVTSHKQTLQPLPGKEQTLALGWGVGCPYPTPTPLTTTSSHGLLQDTVRPTEGQLFELHVNSVIHGCEIWKDSGSRCSEGHVGVVGVRANCWRPSSWSEASRRLCQD